MKRSLSSSRCKLHLLHNERPSFNLRMKLKLQLPHDERQSFNLLQLLHDERPSFNLRMKLSVSSSRYKFRLRWPLLLHHDVAFHDKLHDTRFAQNHL